MDNFIIDTAETVYTPAEDSYMLAENLLRWSKCPGNWNGIWNSSHVCFKTNQ